jgi:hypothetical protein
MVVLFSVCGAINVLFRIPDFFRFEFDRVEVTSNLDLSITSTDLGSFFSKFMLHSNPSFSLSAEYEGSERELFNRSEAMMMENFRVLLDVLLLLAIVAFVLTVFLIVIMQFNRMARNMRRALNVALVIYLVTMVGLGLYIIIFDGYKALQNIMFSKKFAGDDLLQQMFDGQFPIDSAVAIVVISFIFMMIIRYIVWRMTAQKGIFSEDLKGIAK